MWYIMTGFNQLFRAASQVSPSCPAEFPKVKGELPPERGKRGFMNILLQNKRTLNYVEGTTGWTTRRDKAHVFGTGLEAVFFCLNHHIANMQILGEFTDQRMNFSVPVTDYRGD